jgi:hypothetical protein
VDRLHGASARDDCPGADQCTSWRWLQECKECPRAIEGRPPARVDLEFEREACAHIERLLAERRAGFNTTEPDEAERELMIVWLTRERSYEQQHLQSVADVGAYLRAQFKLAAPEQKSRDFRDRPLGSNGRPLPKQAARADRSAPRADGMIEFERVDIWRDEQPSVSVDGVEYL